MRRWRGQEQTDGDAPEPRVFKIPTEAFCFVPSPSGADKRPGCLLLIRTKTNRPLPLAPNPSQISMPP